MATYHPPKIITTQASPAITADLAYEAHGKCGQTRILTSSKVSQSLFDSSLEQNGNAYKMVVLRLGDKAPNPRDCPCDYAGVFKKIACKNISPLDISALTSVPITEPFELYGDFTLVELETILPGFVVVLYMDCKQS